MVEQPRQGGAGRGFPARRAGRESPEWLQSRDFLAFLFKKQEVYSRAAPPRRRVGGSLPDELAGS
ncbi:MAG: hypothetical protein FD166_3597, partial [Bacteroidetes bacterium]